MTTVTSKSSSSRGWFEETFGGTFKSAPTTQKLNNRHRFSEPTRHYHSTAMVVDEDPAAASVLSESTAPPVPVSPEQRPLPKSMESGSHSANVSVDNISVEQPTAGCLGLCGTDYTYASKQKESETIRDLKLQNAKLILRNGQLEQEKLRQFEQQAKETASRQQQDPYLEMEASTITNRSMDTTNNSTTTKSQLETELAALKASAELHKKTNIDLKKQLEILQDEHANMSDQESQTITDLKQQLADLKFQIENERFEKQKYYQELEQRKSYEETVKKLQKELADTSQELQRSTSIQQTEIAPFDISLLDQRDATISELRSQIVSYTKQLTDLQTQLSQVPDTVGLQRDLEASQQALGDTQEQLEAVRVEHRQEMERLETLLQTKTLRLESAERQTQNLQKMATKASSMENVLEENRRTYENLLSELRAQLEASQHKLKSRDTDADKMTELTRLLEDTKSQNERLEAELLQSRLTVETLEHEKELLEETENEADKVELERELDLQKEKVATLNETIVFLQSELDAATTTKSRGLRLSSSIDTEECTLDDSDASHYARQIKERDDAISSLVNQAMEQDRIILELRKQLETYQNDQSDKKALRKLQEEADVFAGQVIELDDEIEQLKCILTERENHARELSKELMVAKKNASSAEQAARIQSLEAELDEMKEAKATMQDELRSLRKKQWEIESAQDEIVQVRNEARSAQNEVADRQRAVDVANKEKADLRMQLEAEREAKRDVEASFRDQIATLQKSKDTLVSSLQTQLEHSRKAYDELRKNPAHMSAGEIEKMQDEIESLKQEVERQADEAMAAKKTIQELEDSLAEQNAEEAAIHEEEKEELLGEIESLSKQLQQANLRIQRFEEDAGIIDEFKDKLERADEAREQSEKSIIETYERKISLLTLDKDVTIDKLRKELQMEKESSAEELEQVTSQLKEYQVEISNLREEMSEQIESRETRIFALEHTLSAQEQLVDNMKTEMDHLQGSMEGTAARRKEEIDEMQQELLSMTAAAAKQDRELESLKLELESKTASHKAEVEKLQEKITALEKIPEEHRNAADLQMELRVKEVKDRLEKLKWRNTSLKEENLNLKERLEQAEALSKENEYPQRIVDLQQELTKQNKRVKELEAELNGFREPPSSVASPRTRSTKQSKSTSTKPPVPVSSPSRGRNAVSSASPSRRLGIFGRKRSVSRSQSRDREGS